MICYKDRTFCGSKKHKKDCKRKITKKELQDAKRIGLPVAYGDFCHSGFNFDSK